MKGPENRRSGSERRGKARVAADLPVQLSLDSGVSDANLRDISLSGVCCITDRAMPVMTQVQLTILLPDELGDTRPVTCAGAVVRSEALPDGDGAQTNGNGASGPAPAADIDPRFETAIFFTHMGETDRSDLEDFVEFRRSLETAAQNDQG